jgi:hypothetical protein
MRCNRVHVSPQHMLQLAEVSLAFLTYEATLICNSLCTYALTIQGKVRNELAVSRSLGDSKYAQVSSEAELIQVSQFLHLVTIIACVASLYRCISCRTKTRSQSIDL